MIYLILGLGLILRLISLNQSLWLDEATSALAAKMSLGEMFTKFLPGDFHPPLYYLILKYWSSVFGYSEVALRIPSVIFGLVTIYAVYLICKEVFNSKVGLIASVLLATSGLHIYYSQEARMYALATMLVSLAFYFFIKKKWLFFAVCAALMGATDYVSLFVIPIFLIAGWRDIKKVILSLTPLAAFFLIWFPVFIKQLSAGSGVVGTAWGNILGTVTFKNITLIPVKFLIGRISFDNKNLYAAIVAVLLAGCAYLLFRVRKSPKILWYWLALPIFLGVVMSFKIPALTYFRFLFCLPAFYILVSAGIDKLGKFKIPAIIFAATINLIFSGYYLSSYKFQREDWRAAAANIGSDKIIFPKNSHEEAMIYYGKEKQIFQTTGLMAGDKAAWLSRYVVEITDPDDSARLSLERLGYNKTSEYNFNGVVFWKYIKK